MKIHNVKEIDSMLIWNWRNDIETRMMSRNSEIIKWEDHKLWLTNKLNDLEDKLYIFKEEQIPIGIVIFSKLNTNKFEISININPELRSKGYGNKLLMLALKKFEKDNINEYTIIATIKKINKKSQSLFLKMLFKLEGSDDEYLYYSLVSK
tara:strand:- start:246 stop:698 length:453 start_codon:yes stop_codon:yes gene_type:complete